MSTDARLLCPLRPPAAPNLFVSKSAKAVNSDSGDDYAAKSHKKGMRKPKRPRSDDSDGAGGRPEYTKYNVNAVDYGIDSEDEEMEYGGGAVALAGSSFTFFRILKSMSDL